MKQNLCCAVDVACDTHSARLPDSAMPLLDEAAILAPLEGMYWEQRDNLLHELERAVSDSGNTDWHQIAKDAHDLSGTAPLFGDDVMADVSRNIEQAIRSYHDEAKRLSAMREQWNTLRAAA